MREHRRPSFPERKCVLREARVEPNPATAQVEERDPLTLYGQLRESLAAEERAECARVAEQLAQQWPVGSSASKAALLVRDAILMRGAQ